jgi:hypothetical protein
MMLAQEIGNCAALEVNGMPARHGIHLLLLVPASLQARTQTILTPCYSGALCVWFSADEFNLESGKVQCVLNGEIVQNSTLDQLIFKPNQIVSFMSTLCALKPGDIIFTGTPFGVGFARKPPVFLKVRRTL